MLYWVDIGIEPDTQEDDKQLTRLKIGVGTVNQVWIGFPDKCFGLAHVQVFRGPTQLWPWSLGSSFHWNNYVFTFQDPIEIEDQPLYLDIFTWNLDDEYQHSVFVGVNIVPPRTFYSPEEQRNLELAQIET